MILTSYFTVIDGWANYVKGHRRANRVSHLDDNRLDTVWLDK